MQIYYGHPDEKDEYFGDQIPCREDNERPFFCISDTWDETDKRGKVSISLWREQDLLELWSTLYNAATEVSDEAKETFFAKQDEVKAEINRRKAENSLATSE